MSSEPDWGTGTKRRGREEDGRAELEVTSKAQYTLWCCHMPEHDEVHKGGTGQRYSTLVLVEGRMNNRRMTRLPASQGRGAWQDQPSHSENWAAVPRVAPSGSLQFRTPAHTAWHSHAPSADHSRYSIRIRTPMHPLLPCWLTTGTSPRPDHPLPFD